MLKNIVEKVVTNNTGLNQYQDAIKEEDISDHRSHDYGVRYFGDLSFGAVVCEGCNRIGRLQFTLPFIIFCILFFWLSPLSSGSQKRKRVMNVGRP